MGKKAVSLKAILKDMKQGIGEAELTEKYDITAKQLNQALHKAVEKGALSPERVEAYKIRAGMIKAEPSSSRKKKKKARDPADKKAAITSRSPETEPVAETSPAPEDDHKQPVKTRPVAKPIAHKKDMSESDAEIEALDDETDVVSSSPPPQGSRSKLPYILIILILVLLGFVFLVRAVPWWASIGIVIGGVLAAVLLARFLFRRFFYSLFGAKGNVLKNAVVEIHEIVPGDMPEDIGEDDEESEDYTDFTWYYMDVTITPQTGPSEFSYWEPGELMLVSMDARPRDIDDDDVAIIWDYRLWDNGEFVEDDNGKHPGPQRIVCQVGVRSGHDTLQFRYYFELFGRVSFQEHLKG